MGDESTFCSLGALLSYACSSPNQQLHLRNKTSKIGKTSWERSQTHRSFGVHRDLAPRHRDRDFKNERSLRGLNAVLEGPSLSFCRGEDQ